MQDIPAREPLALQGAYTRKDCPRVQHSIYISHVPYVLTYRHVQLALKYTRLNGCYGDYLKDLMSPFCFPSLCLPDIESERERVYASCTTAPKITAGRYLFPTTIYYIHKVLGRRITYSDIRAHYISNFCRHRSVNAVLLETCR